MTASDGQDAAALVACCDHCGCPANERIGHDDTCRFGCNDQAPQAPDACDLADTIARFSAEHPWLWRRQCARSWAAAFVGKRLPFLCRHNGTTGPAGANHGRCLWCGRRVEYGDA